MNPFRAPLLSVLLAVTPLGAFAQEKPFYLDASQPMEERISAIISQLTLEEKVRMCFGGETFGKVMFPGVPRLGIPDMRASDGPRAAQGGKPGTVFPAGLGMGATWNPALIEEGAMVLGRECRAKGIAMLLGPAFNIVRDPLGGRFFEYFTEDPQLNGKIAAAFVRGLQNQGTAACIKHLAANGRELNRNNYMSVINERALREIYLPGFEIAVKEGHPWGAMTAANGLNGDLCSDSQWLLNEVLKGEWGFDGFVMTDFCHSRSTEKAALAGLDMDMPWGNFAQAKFGRPLLNAVKEGRVPQAMLDDKVRRILRVMGRVGLLDGAPLRTETAINTPEHQAVALRMAAESLVLLKNTGGLLPLDADRIRRLLVIGPNADRRFCIGGLGGSSGAQAHHEVTPLAGLRKKLGPKAEVEYLPMSGDAEFHTIGAQYWKPGKPGRRGVVARYLKAGSKEVVSERQEEVIDCKWAAGSPDPAVIKPGSVTLECEGTVIAPVTGYFTLRLISDSPAQLKWQDRGAPTITNNEQGTPQANTVMTYLEAGKEYYVKVVYNQTPAALKNATEMNYWARDNSQVRLEWALPSDPETVARAVKPVAEKIRAADAVVFVGGLDHNLDCEGRDRSSMDYPPGQQALIREVAALNPKTVVVLLHGSPVRVDGWLDAVPAVLDAFYPGMEGGTAIAETLFGDNNPSGKLSFTWPKRLEDSPAYALGSQDRNTVNCTEGIFVGYRYFDTRKVEPQFPFGYGLSYTTFKYADLKTEKRGETVVVSLTLTNSGAVAGAEVVQFYVGQPTATVERPLRELKGFSKVFLKPGESRRVEIVLDRRAFAFWDTNSHGWKVEPGKFVIEAGSSSRDIRLTATE